MLYPKEDLALYPGFAFFTRTQRFNPIQRWVVSKGAVNGLDLEIYKQIEMYINCNRIMDRLSNSVSLVLVLVILLLFFSITLVVILLIFTCYIYVN